MILIFAISDTEQGIADEYKTEYQFQNHIFFKS